MNKILIAVALLGLNISVLLPTWAVARGAQNSNPDIESVAPTTNPDAPPAPPMESE